MSEYTRPEGVMGGPCLHCQASQAEHRGLTCDEVRQHRGKAMRHTFAQAHANATLETIKQHLETMIHSAEVYVDAEDVITAYKIKTGALHKLIGHLGLTIPVNHPVVGAVETSGDVCGEPIITCKLPKGHKCAHISDLPRTEPEPADETEGKLARAQCIGGRASINGGDIMLLQIPAGFEFSVGEHYEIRNAVKSTGESS